MKSKITTKKKNKRSKQPAKRAKIKGPDPRLKSGSRILDFAKRNREIKKALPQAIRQLADQRGEKIKNMTTKDILEKVKKELADLTGFKSPSAIGFKKEGNELIATIEVIEKESIPDGMDVLGTYEVRVDDDGKIIGYERTDLRKRVDTALSKET